MNTLSVSTAFPWEVAMILDDDMAILPIAISSPLAVIIATRAFLRISSSSMWMPWMFRSAP